jgi:hypothetical protein
VGVAYGSSVTLLDNTLATCYGNNSYESLTPQITPMSHSTAIDSLLNATATRATAAYLRNNGYTWQDYYTLCGMSVTQHQLAYFKGECPPVATR